MTEKFCGGFPIVTSTKYPYVTYMNKKFNANWRKQFWYFYFVFHLTQRFFYRHISFDIWWWGLNQLSSPNSRRKCFIVGAKFYSKSLSRPNIHGFSNFKDHGFLSVLNFVHPDFASKHIVVSFLLHSFPFHPTSLNLDLQRSNLWINILRLLTIFNSTLNTFGTFRLFPAVIPAATCCFCCNATCALYGVWKGRKSRNNLKTNSNSFINTIPKFS